MMDDVSLYRKYRPQTFSDLVGQDHIRETLLNALRKKQLAHAYLFCGPRGTGKTTSARLVAKGLNCQNLQKNAEPCNVCDLCTAITEGRLIDIIEIDAASNRGIDEIRDLREKIKFAPTRAAKKVYIIDEVHMLTKEAFNALLKTLEEPPAHAHFILATTEIHKVPETIISRCQRFDFRRIDSSSMIDRLEAIARMESLKVDREALELIAEQAEGGLRDAIGLMEQMTLSGSVKYDHVKKYLGISEEQSIHEFLDFLHSKDVPNALKHIDTIYHQGSDLNQFLRECLHTLRERLLEAVSRNELDDVDYFLKLASYLQEASEQMKGAVIPQLPLEMAVIESCFGTREHRNLQEFQTKDASFQPSVPAQPSVLAHSSLRPIPKETVIDARDHRNLRTLECNLDNILNHWVRILDHIKTPSLKRSLSESKAESFTNNELLLIFSSRFHLEKVATTQNLQEIESAFEELFGAKIKVSCELRSIRLSGFPSQDSENSLSDASLEPDDVAQKAAELFGGELIEE